MNEWRESFGHYSDDSFQVINYSGNHNQTHNNQQKIQKKHIIGHIGDGIPL